MYHLVQIPGEEVLGGDDFDAGGERLLLAIIARFGRGRRTGSRASHRSTAPFHSRAPHAKGLFVARPPIASSEIAQ